MAAFKQPTSDQNSLVNRFLQACEFLQIEAVDPFAIAFFQSEPCHFLDFCRRDLKKVLQMVCRQACYRMAGIGHRKDFTPSSGVIDYHRTVNSFSTCKNLVINGLKFKPLHEATLVGSHLTMDRLSAANPAGNPSCRFCNGPKEDKDHLVNECPLNDNFPEKKNPKTDFGPNFALAGIVEVPSHVVRTRLKCSKLQSLSPKKWKHNC